MYNEIWKDIEGYAGYYQVSNLGRVKSLDRYIPNSNKGTHYLEHKKEKILKQHIRKDGYPMIALLKNCVQKSNTVHALVLQAFKKKPQTPHRLICNHIDGVTTNNHIDNLEWVTYKRNTKHAVEIGLMKIQKGETNYSAKLKENDVRDIRERWKNGETQTSISKIYSVSSGIVSLICNRKNWIHI